MGGVLGVHVHDKGMFVQGMYAFLCTIVTRTNPAHIRHPSHVSPLPLSYLVCVLQQLPRSFRIIRDHILHNALEYTPYKNNGQVDAGKHLEVIKGVFSVCGGGGAWWG